MKKISIQIDDSQIILALGAESAGNFSVYKNGKIHHSENFGDLLNENNFTKFQKAVLGFLKSEKIKLAIILTDLHPEMKTTVWGAQLAKKFNAKHIQIQHHHAHTFSQLTDQNILNTKYQIPNTIYGVALDGTGYGSNGKIWGGECFAISNFKTTNRKLQVNRIGYLENQTMIGGDLAIREPARMLIGILSKTNISSTPHKLKTISAPILQCMEVKDRSDLKKKVDLSDNFGKNLAYHFVKKYYSKNQFELLYNQLRQNFNCQETSSAGRILDAVAILLGFAKNERKYKHQASDLLVKNSTKPYTDLKPKILREENSKFVLNTTRLFEYLIKNLHRDKHRLGATAQLYIAEGMYEIIEKHRIKQDKIRLEGEKIKVKSEKCRIPDTKHRTPDIVLSGGISDNKIIFSYFISENILLNKKPVVALGDAGLSVGQIACLLFKK